MELQKQPRSLLVVAAQVAVDAAHTHRVHQFEPEPRSSTTCAGVCAITQNQSLRYATHQLAYPMGMVAKTAHQNGSDKSATKPNPPNVSQKTFRCTTLF